MGRMAASLTEALEQKLALHRHAIEQEPIGPDIGPPETGSDAPAWPQPKDAAPLIAPPQPTESHG